MLIRLEMHTDHAHARRQYWIGKIQDTTARLTLAEQCRRLDGTHKESVQLCNYNKNTEKHDITVESFEFEPLHHATFLNNLLIDFVQLMECRCWLGATHGLVNARYGLPPSFPTKTTTVLNLAPSSRRLLLRSLVFPELLRYPRQRALTHHLL
jgi:hypothetical protein